MTPKTDPQKPTTAPADQPTTQQEEWGERIETSRDIARGGKDGETVRGATGDDPADPRSGHN
jgi:hypothetical protein